jgi:hypothetical protein
LETVNAFHHSKLKSTLSGDLKGPEVVTMDLKGLSHYLSDIEKINIKLKFE